MRERVLALALCLIAGTTSSIARAGDAPPSAEHDAAFRNGLDQFSHGNNVGAIATWESLLGTLGEERGYKVLYNLGLAYQAIGDVTHAIERYRAFVKQVGKRTDVSHDLGGRAADAQKRLEQLEQSHGAVHVRAPTRGGLVLTRVGTSEARAAGYVVWLAPGEHVVELFVGTDHVKRMDVRVEKGRTIEIETSAPEPPATVPPPVRSEQPAPAPERREGGSSSTWIWIGAGATVVTSALPAVTYLIASNERSDAEALGTGHSGYADASSSFETWRTLHYVSYAVPAAFAIATLAYVIARPSSDSKTKTTVGIGPSALVVRGSF